MPISFCGLPVETTQTTIEPSESNKLRDRLLVNFDRPYSKRIYGSKKEKIDRNPYLVALVPRFLASVYENKIEDIEDADVVETFEAWVARLAFQRANILLMTRARTSALQAQKMSVDTVSDSLDAMSSAGRIDEDALAQLEAKIAQMRAALLK